MNVSTNENGSVVVTPDGRLDALTSVQLEEAVNTVSEAKAVVLDFANVDYISSAGIRQVLVTYKKALAMGAEFSVTNAGQQVMNIFKMTGLDTRLDITPAE